MTDVTHASDDGFPPMDQPTLTEFRERFMMARVRLEQLRGAAAFALAFHHQAELEPAALDAIARAAVLVDLYEAAVDLRHNQRVALAAARRPRLIASKEPS